MIPIKLTITGFLSYRDTTELDFTSFELACISGPNGAGKSSLLDAFTWALFGQARKRDESLINLQSSVAEVALVFAYEGNTYRVQRTMPKGKTSMLEFQIQEPGDGRWKALTGHSLRDTQAAIEHTLRLDYETFVNASFFLQGKADQFTQQKATDRKRILGSILGLEVWETYRDRVIKRRREAEAEIQNLEGRMQEINAELEEEQERTARLSTLQAELKRLAKQRKTQEGLLEQARQVEASLYEQRKLVDMLKRQLQSLQTRQTDLESLINSRIQERESFSQLVANAGQIESAYTVWQSLREQLAQWEEVARRFREFDAQRQAPRMQIEAEKARLSQELESLLAEERTVNTQASSKLELETRLSVSYKELEAVEATLKRRSELDSQLQAARTRQAEARAENPRLKAEMDQLKARIDQLSGTEGAVCPLCGRPLETHDRLQLIEEISAQGKEMGDRYRDNLSFLKEADQKVTQLENEIGATAKAENDRIAQVQAISRLENQVDSIRQRANGWQQQGAPRAGELKRVLSSEEFSIEARQQLAKIDVELKAIGYDAAAHDACRKREAEARAAEVDYLALERARASLQPLQREIEESQKQLSGLEDEIKHLQEQHGDAVAHLAAAEAIAPDVETIESGLHVILEQENSLRMEVGAAQQKVMVLKDLKAKLKDFTAQREHQARLVGQYKLLDRAFGKDGVPALLIEQALPEIETRANELLERLSEGNMSVRFVTQAAFKDKKREDLKETLDILISDGAGTRDYELYSGGEAFRVNFAIRLALSELLAKRAGARLQTLVVDEGFGSQDAQGRQHLIEAINQVKQDFAKVLIISHIDELKEAFPNRIEVEKTERGSTLRVV